MISVCFFEGGRLTGGHLAAHNSDSGVDMWKDQQGDVRGSDRGEPSEAMSVIFPRPELRKGLRRVWHQFTGESVSFNNKT